MTPAVRETCRGVAEPASVVPDPGALEDAQEAPPRSSPGSRARRLVRAHWPFLVVLAAGAGLRVAAASAYGPALLLFGDSYDYLRSAHDLFPSLWHPFGYPLLLKALWWTDDLAVVTAVQHVMGLMLGVGSYWLLRSLGVRRWLAVAGAVPMLLDAYQVNVEQFVMAETLFQGLLFGGMALLLARDRPPLWACAGAGAALGLAGLTRTAGLVVLVPCLAFGLTARWGPRRLAAFALAALVPVGAYATWFHSVHHRFALEGYGGRFLYGRVAPLADCRRFDVTPAQAPLCERSPVGDRLTRVVYIWGAASPFYRLDRPVRLPFHRQGRAQTADDVAGDFARRVIAAQPGDYAHSVLSDLWRYVGIDRSTASSDFSARTWQFHAEIDPGELNVTIGASSFERGLVPPDMKALPERAAGSPGAWLAENYRSVYTPGPLAGLLLLVSVLAAAGWPRRPDGRRRRACAVLASSALLLVLVPAATVPVDFRYLLPAVMLLAPAGALATESLLTGAPRPWPRLLARPRGAHAVKSRR